MERHVKELKEKQKLEKECSKMRKWQDKLEESVTHLQVMYEEQRNRAQVAENERATVEVRLKNLQHQYDYQL